MKIASRPAKPELEMVDCATVDITLDIAPMTNRHTLTVKVLVDVPHDVAYDYDRFSAFINDVRTSIKVVR